MCSNRLCEIARLDVADIRRQLANPRIIDSPSRASVAIVLRDASPEETSPQVLLMQRAPNDRDPWSAHIAFPGGRRDSTDSSDLDTAKREAHEELGLEVSDTSCYTLVGRLDDRFITRHSRGAYLPVLCAFVFYQFPNAAPVPMKLQDSEVASAFWAPLSKLHVDSPRVAVYIFRPPPPRNPSLFHKLLRSLSYFFGLTELRMPAIDVLPDALVIERVQRHSPPHVLLWGLTLGCVGDIISAQRLQRVDYHPPLPNNPLIYPVLSSLAYVWHRLFA